VIWIHVLSAVIWIGGMAFISLALVPALKRGSGLSGDPSDRSRLLSSVTNRFNKISWSATALLLATGTLNVVHRHGEWSASAVRLLSVKLSLILLMVILSGLHDFVLGPRLGRLERDAASNRSVGSLRRIVPWLARFNLILALAVVYLAVLIARS
jgi:putative copper resistance protein D